MTRERRPTLPKGYRYLPENVRKSKHRTSIFLKGNPIQSRSYAITGRNFCNLYAGSYANALMAAKSIVKKHGEGTTLIIEGCSPKKDGEFMLLGNQFVNYKYLVW